MNGFTRRALPRWMPRLALMALACLAAAPLTGCANDKTQREKAALMAENSELRDRNAQLEGAVSQLEQQRALLEGELRTARADASRTAARGNTGFEGVSGVSAERLGTGEILVTVANDILFDSGKATLKASAKQTLDQVAGVLNSQYSDRLIQVAGHTDSDPIKKSGWKTNERLSAERALAVEEYLASKGVSNDTMYVAAFGAANPKATKKDSRRVEILVLNARR